MIIIRPVGALPGGRQHSVRQQRFSVHSKNKSLLRGDPDHSTVLSQSDQTHLQRLKHTLNAMIFLLYIYAILSPLLPNALKLRLISLD